MPGLDQEVDMDTRVPTDVDDIIKFAAIKGNLNVVITTAVQGKVKLSLQKVRLCQLLHLALASVSPPLAYEVEDNIITIMTEAEYVIRHGVGFHDRRVRREIVLKTADPDHIAKLLQSVRGPQSGLVADSKSRTLFLYDTREKIREMEQIIARAEAPAANFETKFYSLHYADLADIEPLISSVLTSPDLGSVKSHLPTRSLIVSAVPNAMEQIDRMITEFDKPARQVFLEAKVVEVTLDEEHNLGINWTHLFQGLDPRFDLSTIVSPGLPGLGIGDGGLANSAVQLSYNTIVAGGELTAVLRALEDIGDTKSLSNPQIVVRDGEEAIVKVVEDQPYKEKSFESGSTNIISEVIKFVEVGIILQATPTINELGYVSVDIMEEISSIVAWFDGEPQRGTPVVRKAVAETSVAVKNGVTIVIAGLIRDTNQKTVTGVPFFKDIPLLGYFFKQSSTVKLNTEVVIFLTPRIVTGDTPFSRSRVIAKKSKGLRKPGRSPAPVTRGKGLR
jgi:type II secretory pathway component GspD/PulD (secretin)